MKTAIPSTAKDAQNPTSSSHTPLPSPHSGHLAQLASMMNQSPQAQAQLKVADEIQNSEPVQRQIALAAEINQKQGRVKPVIQTKKGHAVSDDAGVARAGRSQRIVQRVEKRVDGKWVTEEVKFETLTAEQVKEYQDKCIAGEYKLNSAERRQLGQRASTLQNSEEAKRLREQKAQESDLEALRNLDRYFREAKEWKFVGAPSHMGRSSTHGVERPGGLGYLQNWEATFDIGGLPGVLHLHFNTDDRAAISAATLGRAHIKTHLTSKVGYVDAPRGIVEKAIEAIPKS